MATLYDLDTSNPLTINYTATNAINSLYRYVDDYHTSCYRNCTATNWWNIEDYTPLTCTYGNMWHHPIYTADYDSTGYYTIRPNYITGLYHDYHPMFDSVAIKRQEIKNNLTIIVKSRAPGRRDIQKNEWVAMQTLREMISEADFRKYLKYGFILVTGQSGKTYQVFRNKSHTKVYLKGELLEEICVRIPDSSIPATDSVIAFKTIIETDENHFASLGNRYNMRQAA